MPAQFFNNGYQNMVRNVGRSGQTGGIYGAPMPAPLLGDPQDASRRAFANGYADLGADGRPTSVTIDNRPAGHPFALNPGLGTVSGFGTVANPTNPMAPYGSPASVAPIYNGGEPDIYQQRALQLRQMIGQGDASGMGASAWNDLRDQYQNAVNQHAAAQWQNQQAILRNTPAPTPDQQYAQLMQQQHDRQQVLLNNAVQWQSAHGPKVESGGGLGGLTGSSVAGFDPSIAQNPYLSQIKDPQAIGSALDTLYGAGYTQKSIQAQNLSRRLGRPVTYADVARYGDPETMKAQSSAFVDEIPKQWHGHTAMDLLSAPRDANNVASIAEVPGEQPGTVKAPAMKVWLPPAYLSEIREHFNNVQGGAGTFPEPGVLAAARNDQAAALAEAARRAGNGGAPAPAAAAPSAPPGGTWQGFDTSNAPAARTLGGDLRSVATGLGQFGGMADNAFGGGLNAIQNAYNAARRYVTGSAPPTPAPTPPSWLDNF